MWSGLNSVLTEASITTSATGFLGVPAVLFLVTSVLGIGFVVYVIRKVKRIAPK